MVTGNASNADNIGCVTKLVVLEAAEAGRLAAEVLSGIKFIRLVQQK